MKQYPMTNPWISFGSNIQEIRQTLQKKAPLSRQLRTWLLEMRYAHRLYGTRPPMSLQFLYDLDQLSDMLGYDWKLPRNRTPPIRIQASVMQQRLQSGEELTVSQQEWLRGMLDRMEQYPVSFSKRQREQIYMAYHAQEDFRRKRRIPKKRKEKELKTGSGKQGSATFNRNIKAISGQLRKGKPLSVPQQQWILAQQKIYRESPSGITPLQRIKLGSLRFTSGKNWKEETFGM